MKNFDWLYENDPKMLLGMVEEGEDGTTNKDTPWCQTYCPSEARCGACRVKWLCQEHTEGDGAEDKETFVREVVLSMVKNGAGRYDYLKGLTYENHDAGHEMLHLRGKNGHEWKNVTGDSLLALLKDIYDMLT